MSIPDVAHRIFGTCLAALAIAHGGGCGYALVQNDKLFGARAIAVVPPVEEEPIGIAGDLAAALAMRLSATGIHLTTNRASADAVLSGRIIAANISTAPVRDPSLPVITIYRVNLVVLATLNRGDKELWHTQVSLTDDFLPSLVSGEPATDLGTEANRREALSRLTRSAAQDIVDQLRVAAALTPPPSS